MELGSALSGLALRIGDRLAKWAGRPRLRVRVEARALAADLVLENHGRRALAEVEVRVLSVEPCGACVQGGPRHYIQVQRVDARLPWPTGEALGRLGPRSGEAIPLCHVELGDDDNDPSWVVVPLAGREPARVEACAPDWHIAMLTEDRPGSETMLPPDRVYLFDAPARIRLAASALDFETTEVTVEVAVSREASRPDRPLWMRDQSATFELHQGLLDRHPMVRTDFYSVGELRMMERFEREAEGDDDA